MSPPREEAINVGRVVRKQSLYASVIRSCANCGAPGFWHNTPGVNVGCYAPEKVTKIGDDPVGNICPNCGASRVPIERLGMIWSKQWRVGLSAVLVGALKDACNFPIAATKRWWSNLRPVRPVGPLRATFKLYNQHRKER